MYNINKTEKKNNVEIVINTKLASKATTTLLIINANFCVKKELTTEDTKQTKKLLKIKIF